MAAKIRNSIVPLGCVDGFMRVLTILNGNDKNLEPK